MATGDAAGTAEAVGGAARARRASTPAMTPGGQARAGRGPQARGPQGRLRRRRRERRARRWPRPMSASPWAPARTSPSRAPASRCSRAISAASCGPASWRGRRCATSSRTCWFAFGYNALGVPVAAGVLYPVTGWLLSPMFAAAAMSSQLGQRHRQCAAGSTGRSSERAVKVRGGANPAPHRRCGRARQPCRCEPLRRRSACHAAVPAQDYVRRCRNRPRPFDQSYRQPERHGGRNEVRLPDLPRRGQVRGHDPARAGRIRQRLARQRRRTRAKRPPDHGAGAEDAAARGQRPPPERAGGVTDGPFAETKEHLGGFVLIEARDLNEAIRIAGDLPLARVGTIEVRPFEELSYIDLKDGSREAAQ